MLLPLYTDRTLRHTPVVNLGLIVVNVVMFLVQMSAPAVESALLLRPYEMGISGVLGSAFLHGGWLHLLGNMLFLYIFGNNINDTLGNVSYLGFYMGGAVASALLHGLIEDNPALGASGAVSAITGAYLVLYPRSRVVLLLFYFVITTFSVPAIWFVGLFFLLDLFQGLDSTLLGGETSVGHWAHIGGGIYGMVIGLILMRTRLVTRERSDVLAMIERWRQRRGLRTEMQKSGQTHLTPFDIVPPAKEDPKLARTQDLRAKINAALDLGDVSKAAQQYADLLQIDDRQVLARGAQMDVANQLYREQRYPEAALAYRRFLDRFDGHDTEAAQAELFLGLLGSRYLNDREAARQHLARAADRLEALGQPDDATFAREEMGRL